MNKYIDISLPSRGIIDSHFHASMLADRQLNTREILDSLFEAGYSALLDIGVEPDDFSHRFELIKDYPHIYMSAGIYPGNIQSADLVNELHILDRVLSHERIVATGEIGLDYFHDDSTKDSQQELFFHQCELSKKHNLPVCIHNRDADDDVLRILKEADLPDRGVIHCFSSTKKYAKAFLDAGYYISFSGNVTYARAAEIQDALRFVPSCRLLLETDAPYLAPREKRGKPNHPGFIQYTYRYAAQARNQDIQDLINTVKRNFSTLFRVSLPE